MKSLTTLLNEGIKEIWFRSYVIVVLRELILITINLHITSYVRVINLFSIEINIYLEIILISI